ncbi:MAG TPA: efflux RND transporter periplasmic adaptor subunit [bacterium]|nr:efflux RND transporter periplasmic adaptor subunit [bacterium]
MKIPPSKRIRIAAAATALAALAASLVIYGALRSRESIYVGTIEVTRVYVSPRVASQVKTRETDEGMLVEEGQTLYTLACEDYAVQKQKLAKDNARAQRLTTSGAMAPERYDSVKASHDANALQIEWCTVRAPLTATVLTKYSEPGEWVQPGVRMMTLGDLTDVWAYVYVAQPMLARLSLGQEVSGYLPEIEKTVDGKIIKINEEAEFTPKNAQTRKERERLVFGIKIRFDNSENILKPGMPIEVSF